MFPHSRWAEKGGNREALESIRNSPGGGLGAPLCQPAGDIPAVFSAPTAERFRWSRTPANTKGLKPDQARRGCRAGGVTLEGRASGSYGTVSANGPPPGIDPEQPRYDWGPYDPSKLQDPPDGAPSQPGGLGQNLSAEYGRSRATAGDCTYDTRVDNPHISAGQVSVHGWWEVVGLSECPRRATVTTVLQAVMCDSWTGACWWSEVKRNHGSIRRGGGAGKRVTARVDCSSTDLVGVRGVADVDLPGSDPSNLAYSEGFDRPCYPDP